MHTNHDDEVLLGKVK